MQAVILAGGLGTRLLPVTTKTPKSMAQVEGNPFLFYVLRLLKLRGITEVVICTGYLGEQVEEWFSTGKEMGLQLSYSRENGQLLGTGGALKLAEPLLRDTFLVINGDTYMDVDYRAVYLDLNDSPFSAIIVAAEAADRRDCDLSISGSVIMRYDKTNSEGMNYVNAGVMGFRREVLSDIAPGQPVSLEADVFPKLIRLGMVKARITTQKFYDIGSLPRLNNFEMVLRSAAV